MGVWALIENDVVREVTEIDPCGRFHPSLTWVAADINVRDGWKFKGDSVFEEPENSESIK